ncbi:hypothetical protein VZT92_021174 [Zoarces viviparus]|uniref:Uncharacterized protein n=1 Tax=Zoarces viviparus TaxID=48416 RepID=A0AAW1EFT0_ZOAVI
MDKMKGETHTLAGPKKRINPCNWSQDEYQRWVAMECQGRGIRHFKRDKISNCWIMSRKLPGFSPGRLNAALQLRANVYPTRIHGEGSNKDRQVTLPTLPTRTRDMRPYTGPLHIGERKQDT